VKGCEGKESGGVEQGKSKAVKVPEKKRCKVKNAK
jgi:hypothetical protein